MPTEPKKSPDPQTRILLVDDHDLVRLGAAQLINKQPDLTVCGEACSVQQAVPLVRKLRPDIVIADISLKDSNGLEMVKTLRAEFPEMHLLVMSMHDEAIWGEVAIRAGASGYIMKEDSIEKLLPAIRTILGGKLYVSELLSSRLLLQNLQGSPAEDNPLKRLSDRELQVLQLLGQWKNAREIAAELHLSPKTVEYYKEQIKEKLKLKSGVELNRFAVQFASENLPPSPGASA